MLALFKIKENGCCIAALTLATFFEEKRRLRIKVD
jgi:hypothetical protein